ncbi:MAG: TonB-dependent receptor [Bacteroidota bacterium]
MKAQTRITYFLFIFILCFASVSAQKGTIRGTVFDGDLGEPLIGVAVALADDSSIGTTTDFDGNFDLNLSPGTYTLEFSYISYQTLKITDVIVKEGEVNLLENISLFAESEQLDEVVITAKVARASEAALLTLKRKSTNLIDGISAAKFKRIGDSNAASAVKRVTGVSVEGGKYVYVRGLGDRYSKTMLNGLDIPGLDPDRNSLQIDIFPTNLMSNMTVYKTSLAELPADFTGGVVNIETKDFPEEETFDLSFSLGYNPQMHGNSDFLTYDGGSTDWLGYDDGTRELSPLADQEEIPSPLSGDDPQEVSDFINSFSPTLGAQTTTSLPDFSLGLSYGNQLNFDNDHNLGYIFSASYKSSRRFYDNVDYGDFQNSIPIDVYSLVRANTLSGQLSEENVLLAGLAGIAYKTSRTKHKISFMRLQNGEKKTGQFEIDNNSDAVGQSGFIAFSDNLEYSQRSLTNILLNGEYFNSDGSWNLQWKASPTFSSLTDPDIRKTAFSNILGGRQVFNAGAGGNPSRIWRYLDETNLVSTVDVTRKFNFLSREAKLKFGFGNIWKERDYSILSYNLQFFGAQPEWTGDPAEVLTSENIYPNGVIYYSSGNNTPNPNEYNSTITNTSAYISTEFNPTSTLKATLGLRGEKFVQRHTGRDVEFANTGETGNNLVDEKVLDAFDLFPSANLIQSVGKQQNLRFSYSRTIARPSFKELSFAQIIDPITNRIFNGGLFVYDDWNGQLVETRIHNLDLRWEKFLEGGQLFSVSTFYKTFDKPIELVRIPEAQTSNEFQPRNVGDGKVYGVELEMRKNLGFLSESIRNLSISTNVTFVESSIEMTETEFNSRQGFEKDGEEIDNTRQMAGQAPYIINAGLVYGNSEAGFDAGLYYNVKGSTLTVVGGGLFPDVFSDPFHALKFSLNKSFGEKFSLSFEVDNILNDRNEEFFEGFQAQRQIFTRLNPGLTFGLGLKYSII